MSKFKKYAKLNPNAVIITHYHTNQKDYKEISYLCKKYNIALIEDCAISHSGNHVALILEKVVIFLFIVFHPTNL